MTRNYKIISSLFYQLQVKELILLIIHALFLRERIFVYMKNTSEYNFFTKESHNFIIEKGRLHDLELAKRFIHPFPWEMQCHDFDGVKDFFVARNGARILHISWIYYAQHHNRLLSLDKNEVEIKYCFTVKSSRGRGIYPKVLCSIQPYLQKNGIDRTFICVEENNIPSIKGIEKAGFMRVGEITLKKIFGFQISSKFKTSKRNMRDANHRN